MDWQIWLVRKVVSGCHKRIVEVVLQKKDQIGNQGKEVVDLDLTKEDLHLEEEKTGNKGM